MSHSLSFNPRSVADSSGFPLQIRIADVTNSSPNWKVYGEEHPWRSVYNQSEGFIDLILLDRRHDVQSMVVECKRVRQAVWVFLIPNPKPKRQKHARLWVSDHRFSKWERFDWSDFQADPVCHESKYCAIPGQEHGGRNLLERTAAELIDAVEAFALQEKKLLDRKNPAEKSFARIYIPVIVTTAELQVSCFDPSGISLFDGTLPKEAVFTPVPYVRFRKALTSRLEATSQLSSPSAYLETERTVFIVNAEKFGQFLSEWKIVK